MEAIFALHFVKDATAFASSALSAGHSALSASSRLFGKLSGNVFLGHCPRNTVLNSGDLLSRHDAAVLVFLRLEMTDIIQFVLCVRFRVY
jgi:hypothetical protein